MIEKLTQSKVFAVAEFGAYAVRAAFGRIVSKVGEAQVEDFGDFHRFVLDTAESPAEREEDLNG